MLISIEIMLYITYLILQSSIGVHFFSLTFNLNIGNVIFIGVVQALALLGYIVSVFFDRKAGVSGPLCSFKYLHLKVLFSVIVLCASLAILNLDLYFIEWEFLSEMEGSSCCYTGAICS